MSLALYAALFKRAASSNKTVQQHLTMSPAYRNLQYAHAILFAQECSTRVAGPFTSIFVSVLAARKVFD